MALCSRVRGNSRHCRRAISWNETRGSDRLQSSGKPVVRVYARERLYRRSGRVTPEEEKSREDPASLAIVSTGGATREITVAISLGDGHRFRGTFDCFVCNVLHLDNPHQSRHIVPTLFVRLPFSSKMTLYFQSSCHFPRSDAPAISSC